MFVKSVPSLSKLRSTLVCGLSLLAPTGLSGAVVDTLDGLSNFGTPQFSSLNLLPGGEVSYVSEEASVDRTVDWLREGTTRLGIGSESQVTVVPTAQLNDGEWGLWAVYFNAGSFVGEVNVLPFTSSTSSVSLDIEDFAPGVADEYILRFRVREAVGDGFSFTEIRAVPEPGVMGLATLGLLIYLRQRRR